MRGYRCTTNTCKDTFEKKKFPLSFSASPTDDLPVDSLYILNNQGILIEHVLEPHAKVGTDKVTEESPLEVAETPRAQWSLGR